MISLGLSVILVVFGIMGFLGLAILIAIGYAIIMDKAFHFEVSEPHAFCISLILTTLIIGLTLISLGH